MNFEDFRARAAEGGLVPVYREIMLDTDTPITAFAKLRHGPFAFLLESAPAGGDTWARYTFMGTEPRSAWRLRRGTVEDWSPALGWHNARNPDDPLADLEKILTNQKPVAAPELGVFWSGAVGYLGYEVVRFMEKLPPLPFSEWPDAIFMFTGAVVVIDNLRGQARVIIGVPTSKAEAESKLRQAFDSASKEIEEIIARLRKSVAATGVTIDADAPLPEAKSNIAREDYMAGVERIKEYIRAGDCFQTLLSRKLSVPQDFDSSDLYRALRAINPSPYMFHLVLDDLELVGSSPELLVRMTGPDVIVRPIAGTRPRGTTRELDAQLEAELMADEKERAEHIMLVDLGRNDLGRVTEFGSVKTTELMKIEKYSHVLHIVSQVEGKKRENAGAMDVIRAVFPAGTVTGAPKVRAMEIINELEHEARGAYAGAVGYISADALNMDLAITISTCTISDGIATIQAGAGIVADSVPEREWDETENKARAMLTAIARVRRTTAK
jgi:anthranilate synthase component 1